MILLCILVLHVGVCGVLGGVDGTPTSVNTSTLSGYVLGSEETTLVYEDRSFVERTYVQYLGIPYAEPPVGERRFRKPVRKQPWPDTYNATYYRPVCYQQHIMQDYDVSEDCLTLDIYAPVNSTNPNMAEKYAIMVFINGTNAGSRAFVGDVLSAYGDVIVVVINFRVSILGFFSTGDEAARGNYGLWDQQLAIDWIKTHAADFGGNNDAITIVGHSSGATHAILQAMYPGNKNLFQRVIAQSGSPIPTFKTTSIASKSTGSELAKIIGCTQATSTLVVSCMRQKSLKDFDVGLSTLGTKFPQTPCIDGEFILGDPQSILSGTDPAHQGSRDMFKSVDLMTGCSNMEGGTHVSLMWAPLLGQTADTFDVDRTTFATIVVPMAIELVYGKNVSNAIIQTTLFQYMDIKDPDNKIKIRDSVVQLSTDIDVGVPTLKTAQLHSNLNGSETYLYQFSANLSLQSVSTPSWLSGASHGETLHFLFGFSKRYLAAWPHLADYKPTETEMATANKMMKIWSQFAKTGNPNDPDMVPSIDWKPFGHMTSPYLDIDHEHISSEQYFREPFMTFWTKIVPSLEDLSRSRNGLDPDTLYSREQFSDKFGVDRLTADNIIVALIAMCGALLIAFILVCSLAIVQGHSEKYSLKVV